MQITLRFFAILKDKAGVDQMPLQLPAESNVATAMDAIGRELPIIKHDLYRCAIAVNRQYVKFDAMLNDGDELALIPPVSGG